MGRFFNYYNQPQTILLPAPAFVPSSAGHRLRLPSRTCFQQDQAPAGSVVAARKIVWGFLMSIKQKARIIFYAENI